MLLGKELPNDPLTEIPVKEMGGSSVPCQSPSLQRSSQIPFPRCWFKILVTSVASYCAGGQ